MLTVSVVGFRIRGSGFRVWSLGSRAEGLGSRFRVQGLGSRVQGSECGSGSGFGVWGRMSGG